MNILTFIPYVYTSIHVHIHTQSNKNDKTDSVYVIFPRIFRSYFTGSISAFLLEEVSNKEYKGCYKEDVVVYCVHWHSGILDRKSVV